MTDDPQIRIAVRDYVDREVARATAQLERHFVSVEAARVIAETTVNVRLEGMNEFREENRRNTASFVRREVHEKDIETLRSLVLPLTENTQRLGGATDLGRGVISLIVALSALGVALLSWLR